MNSVPFRYSRLRRVTGEDKIASFDRLVAGVALSHQGLTGGFAVVEVSEPPAARRGILLRVPDHELDPVLRVTRHEGLGPAKGPVVLLRGVVTPGEPGNDGAVRKRQLPRPVGLDRRV